MKSTSVFLAIGLCLSCGLLQAQQTTVPGQITAGTEPGSPGTSDLGSSDNIKNIPELYPGEVSDFGTQQIVQRKEHRKWVELTMDWQAGYTDNYLLTNVLGPTLAGGKPETTQMASTWDAAFAPDPFTFEGFKLVPRAGFRETFWNYGIGTGQNSNFAAFDFDTQTIYGETRALFADDWSATVGVDWTRIDAWNTSSEIYRQYGPKWGVAKLIKFDDYNAFNISVDQQYLFTEVQPLTGVVVLGSDIYDRLQTTLSVSYLWSPVDRLFVTPYYRMTHAWYQNYADAGVGQQVNEERSDITNTVGVVTAYKFNDYVTGRVYVSYEKRTTTYSDPTNDPNNLNVPEYSKFDSGLGGAVTIRF